MNTQRDLHLDLEGPPSDRLSCIVFGCLKGEYSLSHYKVCNSCELLALVCFARTQICIAMTVIGIVNVDRMRTYGASVVLSILDCHFESFQKLIARVRG